MPNITSDPRPITVCIADDHAVLRDSLERWLNDDGRFEVIASVGSADEAVPQVLQHRPDVVVFDIDMPGRECFEATRALRKQFPELAILFLSAHTNDSYIEAALAVEALGYLTKNEPPERLAEAIVTVASGGVAFSSEVQSRIVVEPGGIRLAKKASAVSTLSPREFEMLRYIAQGMSKKEIAEALGLSPKTVDNHATSMMGKLDLHDKVQLTRFALREGIVHL